MLHNRHSEGTVTMLASIRCAVLLFALGLCAGGARAQAPADFYKNKTISIVVSYSPGGGYDLSARLVSRFLGRYIPGQPSIVVQNMPGGGSRIAGGYMQSVAPQDGTVMAIVSQYLPLAQLMDGDKSFDMAKFKYVGNLGQGGNNVMGAWAASGVKTIEDLKTHALVVGSTGPQTNTEYYPAALENLFGYKFKVIAGYIGTPDIFVAIERGELEGFSSSDWPGLKRSRPAWIKDHKLNIIAQIGAKREAELPDVPTLLDLARNDEQRQILDLVTTGVDIGRPFFVGPRVPQERVDVLRTAFDKMFKDPEFLQAAKDGHQALTLMSGVELQALVERTMGAPPAIVEKTKAALTLPHAAGVGR
jgi:tripartite-type tricarboxylate transporter receptor subunit TctC